ncbi:hypothetical protein FHJ31_18695 [Pseudomonas sp. Fig-3]|uniref:hypothetical protein n=1 Tax=unclassified Pseudomonas TaxID=196821 RepID=UPI001111C9D2|nr:MULTISPECIES: hypothetical protein [unclassified Pseudomonas]TNB81547.1 hypothetical protein FHJ31_18695 [Pseudomonas sp. Fig-3]
MMQFSVKSTIAHVLLILSAMALMLLIAWIVLQLSGAQIDWFGQAHRATPYLASWRALLYALIIAGWTAALRLRPAPADQQRLKRLGLIGFSSIILVELSRV